MLYQNLSTPVLLFIKYKRVGRQLYQLSTSLLLIKVTVVAAMALFLITPVQAQQCKTFHKANAANPLKSIIPSPYYSGANFVDIDGDGDLDCYIDGEGKPAFFKNEGTKAIPNYKRDDEADGITEYVFDVAEPSFADLDGDGDYDCFFFAERFDSFVAVAYVLYYENIGNSKSPQFVSRDYGNPLDFVESRNDILSYVIADIDGDGKSDVVFADGDYEYTYINNGPAATPQFTQIQKRTSTEYINRIYYDWNKDGLIDYFDRRGASYYRNTGPALRDFHYVLDTSNGPDFGTATSRLDALVDINNDGVPEAFTYNPDLYTLTPVPVIRPAAAVGGITILHASPNDKNYTYRWQRNGKSVAYGITANLPALIAGYYTVTITDSCGTGVSLPYAFHTGAASFKDADAEVEPITSLKNANTLSVKAYPNPFTDEFILDVSKSYREGITVKISDIQGRLISTVTATNSMLHLGGNLQKGIYIVQVFRGNNVIFNQTIIKQ